MITRINLFQSSAVRLTGAMAALLVSLVITLDTTAQDFELYRPRRPESTEGRADLPDEPKPVTGDEKVLVDELKGLIFVDHPDKVVPGKLDSTGIMIKRDRGLALVDTHEFYRIAASYLGGPISIRRLNEMTRDISLLYSANDQPVVDLSVPEQDITDGVVQVVITEGRVGQVRVETRGWFDPCMLASKTCIRSGDLIYESLLMEDLRYLNLNPYREVDLRIAPGENHGETDVIFDVRDRLPIGAYIGYEDTGNQSTGLERTTYGLNWGNAFGLDHSMGYQYTASLDYHDLQAHSGFYSIPLHNRDQLVLYGSHATVNSDFLPGFDVDGFGTEFAFRYYRDLYPGPCCPRGCLQRQLILGFDFKRTNTSMFFGQSAVFDSLADIAQMVVGYESTMQDCWGTRRLGITGFISPGGFSTYNDDAHFDALQPGASAQYIYARAFIEQTIPLSCRCQLYGKFTGQVSESTLLSNEQLGFGGYNSIRGYDMRQVNGDQGWILNLELRTDLMSDQFCCRRHELQGLAFFDYGDARRHHTPPGLPSAIDLYSVGIGLRYNIQSRFALRADYGWQLAEYALAIEVASRCHIGAVATY